RQRWWWRRVVHDIRRCDVGRGRGDRRDRVVLGIRTRGGDARDGHGLAVTDVLVHEIGGRVHEVHYVSSDWAVTQLDSRGSSVVVHLAIAGHGHCKRRRREVSEGVCSRVDRVVLRIRTAERNARYADILTVADVLIEEARGAVADIHAVTGDRAVTESDGRVRRPVINLVDARGGNRQRPWRDVRRKPRRLYQPVIRRVRARQDHRPRANRDAVADVLGRKGPGQRAQLHRVRADETGQRGVRGIEVGRRGSVINLVLHDQPGNVQRRRSDIRGAGHSG